MQSFANNIRCAKFLSFFNRIDYYYYHLTTILVALYAYYIHENILIAYYSLAKETEL